jgi:D-xylose transport system substrate-binding protein
MRKRTLYQAGAAVAAAATLAALVLPATVGEAAATPTVKVTQFTNTFHVMTTLTSLAKEGKGKVAAILPTTTSSTRYVEFDQPDLKKAMQKAGLPTSDIIVQNAQGSDTTQLTDAETDITNGATVLLVDPLDSGVGGKIESYAKSHGVKVIDYDRLTLGGSRAYYVSFNNVQVGQLIGKGFVSCVGAWHVKSPRVIMMHGAATDNNATLFYQGYYTDVLHPFFAKARYKLEARTADTWTPTLALTEFESAYTAHPTVNAAVIPNDETAAPIISYLEGHGVKPKTFPTTGQDATLIGLDNVLAGYQCGTVYKPIYKEAQGAVALALYLRAGKTPPSSLVNGKVKDTTENKTVPSVLLIPEWVTTSNMKTTIVKDDFVPTKTLCAGQHAADCKAAGITPKS